MSLKFSNCFLDQLDHADVEEFQDYAREVNLMSLTLSVPYYIR